MGRRVMRVPIDFDHPLRKTWPGYVSPQPRPCPEGEACHNGQNASGGWLHAVAHLLGMIGESGTERERSRTNGLFPHPWLEGIALAPTTTERIGRTWTGHGDEYVPCVPKVAPAGPDFEDLVWGLIPDRKRDSPFGHDGIDTWGIQRALVTAAGLDPDTWGRCPTCKGHACHPDDIDLGEDWEPTHPPLGDAYQLWETVSEGSPISPVFETLDGLCRYASENCTTFGDQRATPEEWLTLLTEHDGTVVVRETMPDGGTALWI